MATAPIDRTPRGYNNSGTEYVANWFGGAGGNNSFNISGASASNTPVSTGNTQSNWFGQAFQGQTGNTWMGKANAWGNKESFLGNGISNMQMAQAGGQILNQGVNLLAGKNETTVGNVMQTVGGLASNIPGVGGLIGTGVSLVGGLINAAFGSHINKEFVQQTENNTRQQAGFASNATTNASLLSDWANHQDLAHVQKSEVGSDGWFSNKAKRKTRALNEGIDRANYRSFVSLLNTADNVDSNNDLMAQANYAAYGGPLNKGLNIFSGGGYMSMARELIKNNEGWSATSYSDAPKGKNWRSIGWGFNDSGFREKYKDGISNHYKKGITKEQAEQELTWYLNKAEKTLKGIYGSDWSKFSDEQKAAILDTYYQRPASVGKNSRFYSAVKAGEKNAASYLGVAGFSSRNNKRQSLYAGTSSVADLISGGKNIPSTRGDNSTGDTDYQSYFSQSGDGQAQEITIPGITAFDGINVTPTAMPTINPIGEGPSVPTMIARNNQAQQVQAQLGAPTAEQYMQQYAIGDNELNFFDDGGGMAGFGAAFGNASSGANQAAGWMGQASTTLNTIANWGKKDPSLGRNYGSGPYGIAGQLGMATYDIASAIRQATKSEREDPITKLGLGYGGHLYADGGAVGGAGDASGGGVGAMGYAAMANSALKLASNAVAQASIDDTTDLEQSISRKAQSLDEAVGMANTNDDILNLYNMKQNINQTLSARDLRDKSLFDDFLDSVPASFEGFNAGSSFGPWGAAIGGVVGGVSSVVGSLIGRNKAKHKAEELNRRIKAADERMDADIYYAANRVDEQNDLRALENIIAMGGSLFNRNPFGGSDIFGAGSTPSLSGAVGAMNNPHANGGDLNTHGADFTNGLTFINEGGTHEQNPLGGVPMGADQEGTPNLVEEGEVIWQGDYVFSDRLKVPKKLREKYNLPEGSTFADAAKKLSKESEQRPNDPISRRTLDAQLGEFSDNQEEIRQAKQERKYNKQVDEQLAAQQLMQAFGGGQFAYGGPMGRIFGGDGPDSQNLHNYDWERYLAALNAYQGSMTAGNLEGNYAVDKNFDLGAFENIEALENSAEYKNFTNYILSHGDDPAVQKYLKALDSRTAQKGSKNKLFGTDGKLASNWAELYKARRTDKKGGAYHLNPSMLAAQVENPTEVVVTPEEKASKTGKRYFYTTMDENGRPVTKQIDQYDQAWLDAHPEAKQYKQQSGVVEGDTTYEDYYLRDPQKSKAEYLPTAMRYAPIIGSFGMALQNLLTSPDYGNANAIIDAAYAAGKPQSIPVDVIGDYRKKDPFDERYLTNIVNQNNAAANRAAMNIGGNRALGISAILANNYGSQAKLAEVARQAYLANRADDAAVSEFNRGTNQYNATANNQRNIAQAQLNAQQKQAQLQGVAQGYRLRQALDDQRAAAFSQNLTAGLQGLGDMGWENMQRNWLTGLAESGVLKAAMTGSGTGTDGKITYIPQGGTMTNPPKPEIDPTASQSKSNGGRIKKSKKRRF